MSKVIARMMQGNAVVDVLVDEMTDERDTVWKLFPEINRHGSRDTHIENRGIE